MSATAALAQLALDLGAACGFALALIEESVIVEGGYLAATARSLASEPAPEPAPVPAVRLEALAKILISPNEAGGSQTWALVFFFVNRQRVAPAGMSHLTLKLDREGDGASRWVAVDWEEDEHQEWSGLERLDPE